MTKFLAAAVAGPRPLGFIGGFRRREDGHASGTKYVLLGLPDHRDPV